MLNDEVRSLFASPISKADALSMLQGAIYNHEHSAPDDKFAKLGVVVIPVSWIEHLLNYVERSPE